MIDKTLVIPRGEYFDPAEKLTVVVEGIGQGGRVRYAGDAEGEATLERFCNDFDHSPREYKIALTLARCGRSERQWAKDFQVAFDRGVAGVFHFSSVEGQDAVRLVVARSIGEDGAYLASRIIHRGLSPDAAAIEQFIEELSEVAESLGPEDGNSATNVVIAALRVPAKAQVFGVRMDQTDDLSRLYREKAAEFLEKAQALDGLLPHFVVHRDSDYGQSAYIAWSKGEPSNEQAAAVLDFEFEPDRGESLFVLQGVGLRELSGAADASRVLEAASPAAVERG